MILTLNIHSPKIALPDVFPELSFELKENIAPAASYIHKCSL
jgi:hypothetical protein